MASTEYISKRPTDNTGVCNPKDVYLETCFVAVLKTFHFRVLTRAGPARLRCLPPAAGCGPAGIARGAATSLPGSALDETRCSG